MTTNEQLHSEFDEWHINHTVNGGDTGTCSDNNLYDNNSTNKKYNGNDGNGVDIVSFITGGGMIRIINTFGIVIMSETTMHMG